MARHARARALAAALLFVGLLAAGAATPAAAALGSWSSIGFAGQDVRTIEQLPGGVLLAGLGNRDVYRSTDDGSSWTKIGTAPGGIPTDILSVGGRTYMADGPEVAVSTDLGLTWSTVALHPGGLTVWSLASDPNNASVIWGGSQNGTVVRVVDSASPSITVMNVGAVTANARTIAAKSVLGSTTVYVGFDLDGVWRGENGGATWSPATDLAPANDDVRSIVILPTGRFFVGDAFDRVYTAPGPVPNVPLELSSGLPANAAGGNELRITGGGGALYVTMHSSNGSPAGTYRFNAGTNHWDALAFPGRIDARTHDLVVDASISARLVAATPDGVWSLTQTAGADVYIANATASPAIVGPGSTVTFSSTVGNHGPADATSVVITRTFPIGLDPDPPSFTPYGCVFDASSRVLTCAANQTWGPDPGGVGVTTNLTATVTAAMPCSLSSVATISTTSPDSNAANNSTAQVLSRGDCLRNVTGVVDDGDGVAGLTSAMGTWSVGACPLAVPLVFGCSGGMLGTVDQASGAFSIPLTNTVAYNIVAFLSSGPAGVVQQVAASGNVPPLTLNLVTGKVIGNVVLDGVNGQAHVGACPAAEAGPGCASLRTTDVAADGSYALFLPPGSYRIAAFIGTTSNPTVIGTVQAITVGAAEVLTRSLLISATPGTNDANGDGIDDWTQVNVATVPSGDTAAGDVTVASPSGTTLTELTTTSGATATAPPPAGVQLESGLVNFVVTGVTPGGTIAVDLYFDTIPAGSHWFKLNGTTWVDYPNIVINGNRLTVTLTDNGAGDQDPTPGRIADPGALVSVPYVVSGFFAPVDMSPTVNVAKAGSVVPLKWRLVTATGAPVSDPSSFAGVVSASTGTCAGTPDAIGTYAGSSGLRYLGDGYWQVNWKTPTTPGCRLVTVRLASGQSLTASFSLR